ncbi:MAG: sensor histidine kinase [Ruminococcus sp.]|nr:sensor histidine kinase [Ruminococcus sp.]
MCSTCLADYSGSTSIPVVALLTGITISCLIQALKNKYVQGALIAGYIACCFAHPCFVVFLPLTAYDISRRKLYVLAVPALAALGYHTFDGNVKLLLQTIIFCAAAVMLERVSSRAMTLKQELITTRDTAVENSNRLIKKNEQLIEAQDNEVHLATLTERNRIAREIHDNVGHMLTRTILQMGAIQIINKDDDLKEPLDSVKSTLDEAMNSIRKSVHDLHDDSIDLESALREAIAPLKENFSVSFDYDVPGRINGKIKYCFIAIVKEAVSNIIKHSNGDSVNIIVREHPAMCTLCIEDNGECSDNISSGGIGLENMNDRVKALGGVLNITAGKNGFKIFVSIMKKRNN